MDGRRGALTEQKLLTTLPSGVQTCRSLLQYSQLTGGPVRIAPAIGMCRKRSDDCKRATSCSPFTCGRNTPVVAARMRTGVHGDSVTQQRWLLPVTHAAYRRSTHLRHTKVCEYESDSSIAALCCLSQFGVCLLPIGGNVDCKVRLRLN
jgi:hypothetical protein